MINFIKGIVVGIGGISPGLSGSVLLVIFGLYNKTIEALGTLFKDFKKNVIFLAPLFMGFGVGVLIFSKIVNYLIINFEVYTRFTFLGLVLGTIPLFHKEVKKEGFHNKFYILIAISFLFGISLFFFNKNLFPTVTNPNLLQSFLLGIAVATSTIVPGVDSAVIISSLGLYEIYVSSIANINLSVLIPAAFGLGIGALVVSFCINKLLKRYYTITFSIIFGLFLSIIPNVLNQSCYLGININSFISILLMIVGFLVSSFLGNIEKNKGIIKRMVGAMKHLNTKKSGIKDWY
jgi:putative membrane protein